MNNKIIKQLAIGSLSLLMMGTLISYSAKAKNVSHHHVRITRISHKPSRYLRFRTLLHMFGSSKYMVQQNYYDEVYRTLRHNIYKYNLAQLYQLMNVKNVYYYYPRDKALYLKSYDLYNKYFMSSCHLKNYIKQGNAFNTKIRAYLIQDINKTRKHYGLRPLKVSTVLQQTADYRNPHLQYAYEHMLDCLKYENLTQSQLNAVGGTTGSWIHGYDNHTSGIQYLNKYGFCNYWSENAGTWYKNRPVTHDDGTPDKYSDTTPKNIAYNINDDLINHDNCYENNNGHRKNELGRQFKYLGVGVVYDPQTHMGTFNEQYSG